MKKIILSTAVMAMLGTSITAQTNGIGKLSATKKSVTEVTKQTNGKRCSTPPPPKEWDEAFNQIVEQHKD